MPILHLRITENEQTIKLPLDLTAQKLVFKRAVIHKNGTQSLGGTLLIDLPFINSFEMVSNLTDRHLVLPIDESNDLMDIRFDLNLNGEHIHQHFKVIVNKDDFSSKPTFHASDSNSLRFIDLYFEYQTNHQFF